MVASEQDRKELQTFQQPGIVGLSASIEDIKKRYEDFRELKKALLTPADYYKIKTKDGEEVDAIRKTGWFAFATAFNLSIEILSEEEIIKPEEDLVRFKFTVRCHAPNGRYCDEVGSCDNKELNRDKTPKHDTYHKIRAMASTRAKERAIIYIVGANERAAEDYEEFEDKPKSAPAPTTKGEVCKCDFAQMTNNNGKCGTCGKSLTIGQINALKNRK